MKKLPTIVHYFYDEKRRKDCLETNLFFKNREKYVKIKYMSFYIDRDTYILKESFRFKIRVGDEGHSGIHYVFSDDITERGIKEIACIREDEFLDCNPSKVFLREHPEYSILIFNDLKIYDSEKGKSHWYSNPSLFYDSLIEEETKCYFALKTPGIL